MNNIPTILVISESHEQFASAAFLLRNDGYNVLFEKAVSDSVMFTGDNAPQLIISELAAPNVDGLKLCRNVQKDHCLGTTPVLLVGDLSITSSIVEDGFRCGAVEYLQRPIDPLRLADICRDILHANVDRCPEVNETANDEVTSIDAFSDGGSNLDSLFENESLRMALFDNSRSGLAIFSATGEMVESNVALMSMLDYAEDELRGMTLSDFFFPYDLETGKRALEEMMDGSRNYYRSANGYLSSLGERLWGSLTIVAVTDAEAGSRLLIGIFDDPGHDLATTFKRDPWVRNGNSAILDLTKWKIERGLICEY